MRAKSEIMTKGGYKMTEGWRCEKKENNHRRASWLDYQDPSILLLTLVTTNRLPLFGHLQGEKIVHNTLGQQVAEEIERIPTHQDASAIEIYSYVVMPDHVHILLRIHERLPRHIGKYIYWFKVRCSKLYSAGNRRALDLQAPIISQVTADYPAGKATTPPLFAPEYHDRILTHKGQLAAMNRYIQDNPRRLALKRANKELFKIHQDVYLGNIACTTLGNIFLADYPVREVIQCSRRLTQEQIDNKKAECLAMAEQGVVYITAAISEGEKQIARALRESGYPLLILLHEGFPKTDSPHYRYFKPHGVYFEACAAGKLLLVEPKEEMLKRADIVEHVGAKIGNIPHTTQRYRFVAMNMIAEVIAKGKIDEGLGGK